MNQNAPATAHEKLYQKALKSMESGKYPEAEASIASAIDTDPQNSDYWACLGKIWYFQNRLDEAKDALTMALQLNVKNETALEIMGSIISKQGQALEALAWFEKAYDVNKNNESIARKLAQHYFHEAVYPKSVFYCNELLKLKPNDEEIKMLMGTSFYQMGDRTNALDVFSHVVLQNTNNINAKSSLTHCYQFYQHTDFSEQGRNAILICLKTDKLAHRLLSRPWASLINTDPNFAPFRNFANPEHTKDLTVIDNLNDEFLLLGLERVYLSNAPMEIILTNIRRDLLLNWDFYKAHVNELLPFLRALALVCWYNEFVFYQTEPEKTALNALESELKNIQTSHELIQDEVGKLCLYASYKPLLSLGESATHLKLSKKHNYELKNLLKTQIKDPLREKELAQTIKGFTDISDETSLAVRAMYEGRPYPRWRAVSRIDVGNDLLKRATGLDLLVAGCGTGHEPMQYAMSAPTLNITAIDLSLASMAYGKRMADEYGVNIIDFRHGDLMKVADLNKKFDVITSSGVLHHLKEPEKGFEPLVKILKKGGRMSISLYSQTARDLVLNPAADYIIEKAYTKSEDDIREFRKDIMSLPDDDPRKLCQSSTDFYSLSECTDLLFHVQEHRYTFPKIKAMVEKYGLKLHHVMVESVVTKVYKEMFPDDPAMLNWDHWHEFEQKHPQTFAGMYKTWLKFKDDNDEHPMDPLIRIGLL